MTEEVSDNKYLNPKHRIAKKLGLTMSYISYTRLSK